MVLRTMESDNSENGNSERLPGMGTRPLVSRTEARAKGLKRYFTGEPCKHGHIQERYTKTCLCVDCNSFHYQTYSKKYPDRFTSWELKNTYGITLEEKNELIKQQNGKCAICLMLFSATRHTHVDHCHDTKKIRGILCHTCNVGLGNFKDSPPLLSAAIAYLQK